MPAKKLPEFVVDPKNVNSKIVARMFGLTRQRLSQLHSEGVIRNNGMRGKYVLSDVVQAYLAYLKKQKRGTVAVKLSRQQERKLKLQNNRVAATLVPIDEAAEAFLIACRLWRDGAQAIPDNVAARIAKTDSPKDVRDILTEALNELEPAFKATFDEFVGDAE